jgi:hypothetical protein
VSPRLRLHLVAALGACAACAGQRVEPVIDLTPWEWTWSQATLGGYAIRYGFPDGSLASDGVAEAATPERDPVDAGMLRADALQRDPQVRDGLTRATRFAAYRYDCAREDRSVKAACSVELDFWLLELAAPLADVTLPSYEERFESVFGGLPPRSNAFARDFTRDARGREWLHRALVLESGARFTHYSRPLDARLALAVTAYASRAPDRVVAYDLARDAIGRVRIEAVP